MMCFDILSPLADFEERNISIDTILSKLYEIRMTYSPETPNQRHVRIRLWVRICGHASSI